MASTAAFNPDAIARYEAGGWRAYYDRQWRQLLGMTVTLCQEQFKIPFPQSLKGAYHIVRASLAWVPVDHDERQVLEHLEQFYMLAARYSPLDFDPVRVAALEFRYFDDHRRLVGNPDKTDLIDTLAELHSAIFGITPEEARESAEWRVRAMNTVDTITSPTSRDIEGDWVRLEEDLRRCYRSIGQHLARLSGPAVVKDYRSNDYHFVSHWRVDSTPEEVSAILGDAPALARWWPSVYLDVREVKPGDEQGVGKVVDLYTKGWLPYTLRWQFRVTESRFPHGFSLQAWGDFDGRGIWTFAQDGDQTEITYDWKIRGDKPLFKYFSFAMKPLFAANHRWAMARGEESLKLELARRRARSNAERAAVPAPPQPTSTSPVPLLTTTVAGLGLLVLGARRLARR